MKEFFEAPTITIHDPSLKIVGVIDNKKPKSLHFFDDEWERDLATGASVFSFSVHKKYVSDNEMLKDPASLLKKRNFVSFKYKGETFLFLIYKIKETRTVLELECRNLNLELINEDALPFKSDQPLTFKQYAEKMDLLNFTKLNIGINEIASYTRTLEFTNSETKLARLLALLSKFNAEHEFKTTLNPDGTLKDFKLNVYKEYDGENFGVGKKQKNLILLGERFLTDITRTVDYDGLFTMLVPTSTQSVDDEKERAAEHGQKVTTVKNPDGSTTRTTVWTNMDGSQSKSVITTKVTKNADGSTTTVKRTEKANGSIIETTTVRTSKGNASSTTKVLKPATSNKDTGEKELIDIGSMPDWEVKNDKGEVEFYKRGAALYAPIASKLYPSTFTAETQSDQWIRKDISYDANTSEELEQMSFKDLKLHAYPSISYEIEGWTDLDIGDRVPIQDNKFSPILIIEARVSKQKICFTKPENSRTTYDNFKSLSSNLSKDIQSRLSELIEEAKPYTIQVSTDNGTTFKNGVGESVVKTKLFKGNSLATSEVSWHWLFNGNANVGTQYTVKASDIKETSVLTIIAYVDNDVVATAEVTFTNVGDGVGVEDIERYYTTNNKSENVTVDSEKWSTEQTKMTADQKYTWSYEVTTYTDGTTKVTKPVIIGIRGDDGLDADATGITESLNEAKKELDGLAANVDKLKAETLAAGDEAKKKIETVASDLTKAKTDLQNAVSVVDTKATNLQTDMTKAKSDLSNQAKQITEQASAQSELTKRVTSVEKVADTTKTTVSELSKTVAQNGKDITSATARTKVVEEDLLNTKTTLSQVKTTADSASKKTATLETGLDGLNAKFDNLKIGAVNLLKNSKGPFKPNKANLTNYDNWAVYSDTRVWLENGKQYVISAKTDGNFTSIHDGSKESNNVVLWLTDNTNAWVIVSDNHTGTTGTKITWTRSTGTYQLRVNTYKKVADKSVWDVQIEEGNIKSDYSPAEADMEEKVAEYKKTAEQNYSGLSQTVKTLDGTVKANKTAADQTAAGFKTRIESLETYKDDESTRAKSYFESAKTETARQLTAERTAIAKDYVAKSTYTSDVTGIKNDLSATKTTADTTKTNLANYQASNDKAVVNLQSSLKTTNGNVSNLQTKVEAVPGQISSAINAVEGKIPTSIDTVNLIKGTGSAFVMGYGITNTTWNETKKQSILNFSASGVNRAIQSEILPQNGKFFDFKPVKGTTYTQSIMIDTDATFNPNGQAQCTWFTNSGHNQQKAYIKKVGEHSYQVWSTCTWDLENTALRAFDWYGLHNILLFRTTGTYLAFYKPKLTTGNLPSDWSPAPEDAESNIANLTSEIKQTKNGMSLLATKTELSTAKNDLQSGIKTATDKANTAQSTADTAKTNASKAQTTADSAVTKAGKAQSTADSNAKTISTHTTQISALNTGLSAKVSQTDFNTLSGRVNTAENNITAKANELSSKISSLTVGNKNYLPTSKVINRGSTNFKYNESSKSWTMTIPASSTTFGNGIAFNTNGLNILLNGGETLFFGLMIKANKACSFNYDINNALSGTTSNDNDDRSKQAWSPANKSIPANVWTRVWFSYTAKANVPIIEANSNFGIVNNKEAINIEIKEVMVAKSNVPVDYQTPDADFEAKDTEFKQTAEAIKASVSTLDKSVVKTSSLNIGADGVVIKSGKSTSDIANAIGGYFAVNQGAINMFSDKINVKGSMIVNGAITADKIAAGAINADKISASGITANKIKGGILQSTTNTTKFDLDSGKLYYNSNNTGIFRIQNNASTMGLKFSNTGITVDGTSRILSRVILGGDRRETTLDDGKWDQGGFTGVVIETINGVEAQAHEKADSLRVVADNIYFTHSYNKDNATNTAAAGWKMETFSPWSSYTGTVVLKPFGVNYRNSNIVTGDVRLDNGDGSGYWVRGCIQVLRNCFQHFLNGGTSADAMRAIRNALKDISGV